MRPAFVVLVLLLALWQPAAHAARHAPPPAAPAGTVTRIVDGDTLWVSPPDGGAPLVVRIEGIDAPERCQPGGAEAAAALRTIVLGRSVVLRVKARDDHGRLVARVLRDGEVDVGDRLVRDGHAWSARFRHDRGPYVAQERMALALKRGVHAEAGALMPREFRRRHGPCEPAQARAAATAPAATRAPAPR
jgi:micrococcal nuclease